MTSQSQAAQPTPAEIAEAVAQEASNRAYIQGLLAVAADDARNNLVIAAAEVAAILFVIKDSIDRIQRAGWHFDWVAVAVVALLGLSAMCFFVYAAMINQVRMNVVRQLASNNATEARNLWVSNEKGVKSRFGRWQVIGFGALFLAAIGLCIVVGALILADPVSKV